MCSSGICPEIPFCDFDIEGKVIDGKEVCGFDIDGKAIKGKEACAIKGKSKEKKHVILTSREKKRIVTAMSGKT